VTSITTTYADGIYKDADSDIIRVENGKAEVIGTSHDEQPYINMRQTWKIADLPKKPLNTSFSFGGVPVPAPEPTLPDGIYRERNGDTVLVRDGKAVEILATNDSCPVTEGAHVSCLEEEDFLKDAVRLVAPTPEEIKPVVPADGVYADTDGDIVQIKNGSIRYLSEFVDYGEEPGTFQDGASDFTMFSPYVPLVEEGSSK
jgi:hypothetical protein